MSDELTRGALAMRRRSMKRNLISMGIAVFVSGAAIAAVLDKLWPRASVMMMLVAGAIAILNAWAAWRDYKKSQADYRHHLEKLRMTDPALAEIIERSYP
jgi:hypothetical protein